MTTKIEISDDIKSEFSNLLVNVNKELSQPWISKPSSKLAMFGLVLSLVTLYFTWQGFKEKNEELIAQKNTLETKRDELQGELNQINKSIQDGMLDAIVLTNEFIRTEKERDELIERLDALSEDEGKLIDNVTQLDSKLTKLEDKLDVFYDYVDTGGIMTDQFVMSFLTPEMMVTENPDIPVLGQVGGQFTVSMFLNYPDIFKADIIDRVYSVEPIQGAFFIDEDKSVPLNLKGGDISINQSDSNMKERWAMYYFGDDPIKVFSVKVRLRETKGSQPNACYILTYPKTSSEMVPCEI